LRRGAASVTTLELSPAYDDEAWRLAAEAGVADRAHRRVADIAAAPDDVEPADVVVLHRVVCCYPDYGRLLGAAAEHCRGRLAFSHPPRNLLVRGFAATQNATFRVLGRRYRAFAHPPEAMVGVVVAHGMRPAMARKGVVWQVRGLVRGARGAPSYVPAGSRTVRTRWTSMATRVTANAAKATHSSTLPMAPTMGSWFACPRWMPATAHMPSGNTMLHREPRRPAPGEL